MVRRDRALVARDLVIAVADHFEPSIVSGTTSRLAEAAGQAHRLERWCLDYPKLMQQARDSDGRPLRHTYFYPAEQWSSSLGAERTRRPTQVSVDNAERACSH